MKKVILFASAFVFSISVIAQSNATKQKPQQPVKTVNTPVKEVPPKVTGNGETKPVQTGPSPDEVIKMNTQKHDFGKIKQGVPVTYFFEIKNISDKAIVVENTSATCGCTTPDRIVEPIAPGTTAKLKVVYNAANPGAFTKEVHIKLAGIAQDKVVQITGEVIPTPPATN